jgi:hypothetical protein
MKLLIHDMQLSIAQACAVAARKAAEREFGFSRRHGRRQAA